jgi:hypothetical protein
MLALDESHPLPPHGCSALGGAEQAAGSAGAGEQAAGSASAGAGEQAAGSASAAAEQGALFEKLLEEEFEKLLEEFEKLRLLHSRLLLGGSNTFAEEQAGDSEY